MKAGCRAVLHLRPTAVRRRTGVKKKRTGLHFARTSGNTMVGYVTCFAVRSGVSWVAGAVVAVHSVRTRTMNARSRLTLVNVYEKHEHREQCIWTVNIFAKSQTHLRPVPPWLWPNRSLVHFVLSGYYSSSPLRLIYLNFIWIVVPEYSSIDEPNAVYIHGVA